MSRAAMPTAADVAPKMGRATRAGEAATEVVTLRLTADELARWTAAAAAGDMSRGDWIRQACAGALAKGGKVAAPTERRPDAPRLRQAIAVLVELLDEVEPKAKRRAAR